MVLLIFICCGHVCQWHAAKFIFLKVDFLFTLPADSSFRNFQELSFLVLSLFAYMSHSRAGFLTHWMHILNLKKRFVERIKSYIWLLMSHSGIRLQIKKLHLFCFTNFSLWFIWKPILLVYIIFLNCVLPNECGLGGNSSALDSPWDKIFDVSWCLRLYFDF